MTIVDDLRSMLDEVRDAPIADRVALFNEVSTLMKEFVGLAHPALAVQLVPADDVIGNDYNPNKVAPPEMKLLELSIRRDGITMPVVVAKDPADDKRVVVDGFHRTTIAKTVADVRESLCGYIPVVEIDKKIEDRMASTVRHNLARGTHQVELSAKLVTALTKHHWTNARISEEIGMDADEVLRLKQITGLAEAFRDREFSKSWE